MTTNIFSIGLSGLNAASIGIATTGENISNSSTTGYNVERPVYSEAQGQYTSSGYMGGGVSTATVQRAYNQFLTTSLNNAQSTNASITASYNLAAQLSNLVGSPTSGISTAITTFFSGMQTVANSPSSTAVRQTAISDAQSLADQLNSAGEQYDAMRQSVNTQLTQAVTSINTYTKQIAQLNAQITAASSTGQAPNQLLDQRDLAVSNLSQLIGVQVVQGDSGYSVFLGNGQPLVVASQSYNLTTQPSDSNIAELTVAWAGGSGSTDAPQALTSAALQGGTVGGLVSFVSGTLDPAEAQLGAIATSFAAQVNAQNALGVGLSGQAGGDLFSVNPTLVTGYTTNTGTGTVSAALTDPTAPPTDNFTLSYDGMNYTLTDSTTNTVVATSTTAPSTTSPLTGGGISVTSTGTMNAGDKYTIEPTGNALTSFSVATTDPGAIAAAAPVLVSATTSNTGTGAVTQGEVTAGYETTALPVTLSYDATSGTLSGFPAGTTVTYSVPGSSTTASVTINATTDTVPYDPTTGETYSIADSSGTAGLGNVSFTMTGSPKTGDTFTLAGNTAGTQDARNAVLLANLTSSTSIDGTNTLTSAYANYVNAVGNSAAQLKASSTSQQSLVTQLTSQQQSAQGVNLDEEAANLLQYQQLYQANSKVIQTAASLFQTLIGIFG